MAKTMEGGQECVVTNRRGLTKEERIARQLEMLLELQRQHYGTRDKRRFPAFIEECFSTYDMPALYGYSMKPEHYRKFGELILRYVENVTIDVSEYDETGIPFGARVPVDFVTWNNANQDDYESLGGLRITWGYRFLEIVGVPNTDAFAINVKPNLKAVRDQCERHLNRQRIVKGDRDSDSAWVVVDRDGTQVTPENSDRLKNVLR